MIPKPVSADKSLKGDIMNKRKISKVYYNHNLNKSSLFGDKTSFNLSKNNCFDITMTKHKGKKRNHCKFFVISFIFNYII